MNTHIPHLVVSTAIREQQKMDTPAHDAMDALPARSRKKAKPAKRSRKNRAKQKTTQQNWLTRLFF